MSTTPKVALLILLLAAGVGCDQVTKHAAHDRLAGGPPISFFGDVVRFQYTENTGAFLGLGSNLAPALRSVVFVGGVSVLLLAAAIHLLRRRRPSALEVVAVALFLAGGVGNLIDRVAFSFVRDFVSLGWGGLRTGIFNVADVVIMGGAVLILWTSGGRGCARSDPRAKIGSDADLDL